MIREIGILYAERMHLYPHSTNIALLGLLVLQVFLVSIQNIKVADDTLAVVFESLRSTFKITLNEYVLFDLLWSMAGGVEILNVTFKEFTQSARVGSEPSNLLKEAEHLLKHSPAPPYVSYLEELVQQIPLAQQQPSVPYFSPAPTTPAQPLTPSLWQSGTPLSVSALCTAETYFPNEDTEILDYSWPPDV